MKFQLNPNFFSFSAPANKKSSAPQQQGRKVLSSTIAGSWYPGEKEPLRNMIQNYLATAEVETNNTPVGNDCNIFIVPHAGYQYSGLCAAYAYRHLIGRTIRRVILLAPSHRAYLEEKCVIPESDAVSTPFGEIPISENLKHAFRKLIFASCSDNIHRNEHSTQIQYPFLQTVIPEPFTLLPIITGTLSREAAEGLGAFLKKFLTDDTVLIVSSDFTHYGTDFGYTPFKSDRITNVRKVDLEAYRYIQDGDAEGFIRYIRNNRCTICGAEPIRAMLAINPAGHESTLFKYCTSADDGSGDMRFVCYLACGIRAVFENEETDCVLTSDDKRILLSFARRAIQEKFRTGRSPAPTAYQAETTPAICRKMGAFVTLTTQTGQLRGCIGEIEPYRPLYEAVTARACDAAFRDPRFYSLRENEFGSVEIEISALTPPHPIDDWRKIQIGKHGMTVSKNGRSAVFLPQVAPEQGWTLEQTLTQLCLKAGLAPDDFRSGAAFTVFEAIVFSEDEF